MLHFWQERRIFDKLRRKNAGAPKWSFLDGPITANNPMGVHHAWGRYPQGHVPALPRHVRPRTPLSERVRLPGPLGRGRGRKEPQPRNQARHPRLRHREVRPRLQGARAHLCRTPDRAVRSASAIGGLGRSRSCSSNCATRSKTATKSSPPHSPAATPRRLTPARSSANSAPLNTAAATSLSPTRTTTPSGPSSRSATPKASSIAVTTSCRGAAAAAPGSRRWKWPKAARSRSTPRSSSASPSAARTRRHCSSGPRRPGR